MKRLLSLLMLLACLLAARAQDSLRALRPVTSAYMLELGAARLADTYLTPLTYNGLHAEAQYERTQAMRFSPQRWIMQLRLGARYDHADNPAKNAVMANLMLDASWGMMRRWQLPSRLALGIGPGLRLNGGMLYLSRNGNNPASAKAAFTLDACAYAAWSHRVWRVPFTLRWQTATAVAGAFFSPNYGQLYYQIYLGDTKGLAHFAWPGSYFYWDNLVTADLHFGATTLRLGYHGRLLSTKASHLVAHEYSHALVLGIVAEWISLSPSSRRLTPAPLIPAY